MKKENKLVLELCKFINPNKTTIQELLKQPLNYPLVLGQLLFNRMGATAYYTLKESELLGYTNREFRNTLKAMYDVGREKTDSFYEIINMMNDMLNNASFPYALLKGAYLASLYPEGLRTSNDIDILAEQKDVSQLCNLLKENEFSQGNIRNGKFIPSSRSEIVNSMMNRGETVPFIKKVNLPKMEFCEIDLNFSVDYKPTQNTNIVSSFLEKSYKYNNNGFKTLFPPDFLIHLCLHLYKEATVMAWVDMNRDLSLYKFCDIYLLINEWLNEGLCDEIKSRICEFGVEKECYYAFINTKKLFGIKNKILDKFLSDIKPENTTYLNEITNPEKRKKYRYNGSFVDWFFNSDRKGSLYEITNETT